jgi:FdhD protein
MSAAVVSAVRLDAGRPTPTREPLSEEAPLQVRLDGRPYSITLRTPGHDAELALGLLFAESQIDWEGTLPTVPGDAFSGGELIQFLDVQRAGATAEAGAEGLALANRRLASTSSCGLCGKIEWEPLAAGGAPQPAAERFDTALLPQLFAAMRAGQAEFEQTGGCHAAAAFTFEGGLLALHEDIGRHNAVDKVVGQLIRDGVAAPGDAGRPRLVLCVSGRVAYEIVAKARRAGFAVIAAVGAPSSLSVSTCEAAGIALLGFCREHRATVYTHLELVAAG